MARYNLKSRSGEPEDPGIILLCHSGKPATLPSMAPKDLLSLIVSGLALALSLFNAWFTWLRRGTLQMTRPVLVGLLYDLPAGEPKVFFRAMLFATGKRGHIVESMFLRVRRDESTQTFNFWMYGETNALKIGSGLRVTEEGVAVNHHFLPPKDGHTFSFLPGDYVIEVYARIVMRAATILLSTVRVTLTQEEAIAMRDTTNGVLFSWGPDAQSYHAHVNTAPLTSQAGA